MEFSNTRILNSLFLFAVVSNVFHKPNIEKSLPTINLVTKSTRAVINLNTLNLFFLFFLMFVESIFPFSF